MTPVRPADNFQVINGPEDGTDFPIIRAPFLIGRDPHCEITLTMDTSVEPIHARVSVVSEGYRIRRMTPSPVWANGKRVGRFLSRIVRDGGTVRVGDTVLVLECAPEGLANRSRGAISETDLGWGIHQLGRGISKTMQSVVSLTGWLVRHVFSSWWLLLVLFGLAYVFSPTFRWYVFQYTNLAVQRILYWLTH